MSYRKDFKIAGIDIGFGDVKIVSNALKGGTSNNMYKFPTIITPAWDTAGFNPEGGSVVPIRIGDDNYFVGNDAKTATDVLELRYTTWYREDEYMAFFQKALSMLQPGTYIIVTGLPVEEYGSHKDDLQKRLRGEFHIGKHTYFVRDVKVMPQPFGSFFNYALDDKGCRKRSAASDETNGIIDIGYRTTDFILVEAGHYKEQGASGTINKGVSDLVGTVTSRIRGEFNRTMSDAEARNAVLKKEIRVFGNTRNIGNLVDQEADILSKFIANKAKTYWGSGAHIDRVLLVGGGSAIYKTYMKRIFPHLAVPGEPSFSNACGYWKYGNLIKDRGRL